LHLKGIYSFVTKYRIAVTSRDANALINIDHYAYSFWEFILIVLMFAMSAIRFYFWIRSMREDE